MILSIGYIVYPFQYETHIAGYRYEPISIGSNIGPAGAGTWALSIQGEFELFAFVPLYH